MRAITLAPGEKESLRLEEQPEPPQSQGALLVRALAVGVCGTDRELVEGLYGAPPQGRERLVLGHESLGSVDSAAAGSGFSIGDIVVGVVRHPASVPCHNL